MTPLPQEPTTRQDANVRAADDGARVVISGMSGLYPQAHSVKELSDILYNKINPVTGDDPRWNYNHPEVVQYTGKVPDLDRFDAQFFKVHYRLSNSMDPMARKILEQAYQAIYDAGVSPEHLSGRKVGVFIGTCFSETEKACFYAANTRTGLGIAGCNKAMFANRISYWLNTNGPSMSIDESCCSSIAAVEQAYLAISHGECEAAIVGGANICLHPQSSIHYGRIITMCMDGKTKSFDQNADGCAKSEAINVLFLQKAKDALRIYADVLHVKSEFTSINSINGETGPLYGFYRDPMITANFLKHFYDKAAVSPDAVEYVEAFGSAIPEADKAELEAIGEVFCKNRDNALLVGSVMSNIGYAEAASGISAITKVLLGYETGLLAGNLHCETPRRDVRALREGSLRVLTDHQRFYRTYAAVNAFSVSGVNAHALLHGHYKPKDSSRYKSSIPHLVTISGRQEHAVKKIFNDLKSRSIDSEEIALLHNIHETKMSGHLGRGFIILDTDNEKKTVSLHEKVDYYNDAKRPLWFVYSGMGSQWTGMGAKLMRIPIFSAAIERCRKVLEPKGVDIIHIITSSDKTIYDNILNSFVGIAAVQIGLTDILRELGIVPDKIIGHSVGELGCAYADGCMTAEEMILSAYSRGLVSVQTPFIRGSMAAVGVGYQQISKMCPPDIVVACHNGPDSSTISGPADAMGQFVAQLTVKGIFAKEVPCSNIAYHSRYIAEAGPGLLKYLKEVIKTPKPRSERWVSTSVPQKYWNEPYAKYSSADYHTNNLLSPVLFEETAALIPSNAVVVEVAPHGLLQAILKRSLSPDCCNIALTRRGHTDNAYLLLEAVGKLYMEGFTPKLQALYPKVEFPVSTGTPMLSHLVEWEHSEKWMLPLYVSAHRKTAASCKFVISVHDEEHNYLQGHVIREKTLYPFAAALVAAWDTLAMTVKVPKKQLSVTFHDVHLHAQPVLHDRQQLRLTVSLHRGTGRFEIMDENSKVATGFLVYGAAKVRTSFQKDTEATSAMDLRAEDIYQLLHFRDYSYCGEFRSIHSANASLTEARLVWSNNWVTLIDGMLQLNALRRAHDCVSQPRQIRRICINVEEHNTLTNEFNIGAAFLKANVSEVHDDTRCGGILIQNVKFHDIPPMIEDYALNALTFVPRFNLKLDDVSTLYVYLQLVAENVNKHEINVVGITSIRDDVPIFKEVEKILNDIPGLTLKYQETRLETALHNRNHFLANVDLVLVENLSTDNNLCQALYRVLQPDSFVMSAEDAGVAVAHARPSALYQVVCNAGGSGVSARLQLVRWRPAGAAPLGDSVTVRTVADLPLLCAARASLPPRSRLLVFAVRPPPPGLLNLVRIWREESIRNLIRVVVADLEAVDDYKDIDCDLVFNVWNNGEWGGEYYLPLQESSENGGVTLQSSKIGDLSSLHWVKAPMLVDVGTKVTVHYAGIHSGDILRATGALRFAQKNDSTGGCYGTDFSGITDSGERVMGIVINGACSSEVRAQPELLWPVPAHWSLEDAATVPFAYAHAFYCLLNPSAGVRAEKQQNRYSVLIHGGAGALGQAVISIALAINYEVFTTVCDINKKRFLKKLFPELKEEYIGNSRDNTFGDMVLSATNGHGCDIVISCVKGELKNVSLKCCGSSGITIDTAQLSTQEDYLFGLTHLTKERSYVSIDISSVFRNQNSKDIKKLHVLVSEGIARGYVRPLSRVTYAPHEAPRAFRLLAASQHRGRVLLRLHDSLPPAQLRLDCNPDCCYLIICGQEAFGLRLANRLVNRGAKKLHLHYNNCPPSYLCYIIRSWTNLHVQVEVSSEDLSHAQGVSSLLNNAMRLGPVEGVYTTTNHTKNDQGSSFLLNNLDLETRKLCPSLRYFAVLSTEDSVGKHLCCTRIKDGLPATALSLVTSKMFYGGKSLVDMSAAWCRGAINAMEHALCSAHPVLVAQPRSTHAPSLLHQLAAVANISLPDDVGDSTTLEDLGILNEKLTFVCAFLRNTFNLCIEEEQISSLTIQRITQIEEALTASRFKEVNGIGSFFSYVDKDEMLATVEMVFLPTLTNSATMRDDEFDVSETYLCIVPGLEGHHERFRALCERLKLPALVLQPGLDNLNETVEEIAKRYAKVLLKKTEIKNNFYLLGYECGVLVALELAAILEDHGKTGTVFCVGGGPEDIKAAVEDQLAEFKTEEQLQDAIAQRMFRLIAGSDDANSKDALQSASTWRQKVDACVRSLLGRVSHSAQYARALFESAFARIEQVRRYTAAPTPLRSQLVLLRAAGLRVPHVTPTPPPALQAHSLRPVAVHELSAPLSHATDDMRCAAIINKYLDSDTIEAFEQKNLCDTYLLNAETFMIITQSQSE